MIYTIEHLFEKSRLEKVIHMMYITPLSYAQVIHMTYITIPFVPYVRFVPLNMSDPPAILLGIKKVKQGA